MRVAFALLGLGLAACGRLGFDPHSHGIGLGDDDGGTGSDTGVGPDPGAVGRIASGNNFTCAARVDGSVWCWGLSTFRQIGFDSTVSQPTPVHVTTLPNPIVQLSAADVSTCGIDTGGTVWCWGDNGQMELGVAGFQPLPVTVPLPRAATAVSVGGDHACARLDDATAWCWGRNYDGESGVAPSTVTVPPTQILNRVTQISAGFYHTCALRDDATVWCWGSNGVGALGDNTGDHSTPRMIPSFTALALAAGATHECALLAGGHYTCWGSNSNGQLGRTAPASVPTPGGPSPDGGFVQLAGGDQHTCGLHADSSVECWGDNNGAELGNGTDFDSDSPAIASTTGTIGALSAGGLHTCGLRSDDTITCWGTGTHGELGDGSHAAWTPQPVTLPGAATAIAAGSLHACALVGGQPYCWGDDVDGQIGDSSSLPNFYTATPLAVPVVGQSALAAGQTHSCATNGTTLTCWGSDHAGELGDGQMIFARPPVVAANLTAPIGAVSANLNDTCVVNNGTLACYGGGGEGELGNGSAPSSTTPVAVGIANVSALTGGDYHTCALDTSHHVWCWGENDGGDYLGIASAMTYAPRAQVIGGHLYNKVSSGAVHTCAITTAGAVECWGNNGRGELGDGLYTDNDTPHAGSISSGATAIASGSLFSCAIVGVTATNIECWGTNDEGELGTGTTDGATTPQPIMLAATRHATALAAGDHFACALDDIGNVWCWGDNGTGQIGNDTSGRAFVPAEVVFP